MDRFESDCTHTRHCHRREVDRARSSRYRERVRNQTSPDRFRNTFLHYDPRILSYPPEEPALSVFDDLRAALDALPAPRDDLELETAAPVTQSPPLHPYYDNPQSDYGGRDIPEFSIETDTDVQNTDRQDPIPIQPPFDPPQPVENVSSEAATQTIPSSSSAPQSEVLGVASVPASPDYQPLAECLVDQLLQHRGCTEHLATPDHIAETHSLSSISSWNCPDVLSDPQIAQYGTDWDTLFPVEDRQKVYSGYISGPPSTEDTPARSPAALDLNSDTTTNTNGFQIHFDIDSAGGFASSLAVAREGIKWKVNRAQISNLQSSLHLDPISVHWHDTRPRTARRPLHKVPHLPFGRLAGFPEVEIYLIFPYLYDPRRDHWVITTDEYTVWTDRILLPAIREVYPISVLQHLPGSAQHITLNAAAPQVESRTGAEPTAPYIQDFHFALQSNRLAALWENIQGRVQQQGLAQFRGCQILLTAKNLKLSTQCSNWSSARKAFFQQWHRGVDAEFLTQDFYDIAKEVVPPTGDTAYSPSILSWRRCCLEGFGAWLAQSAASAELRPESDHESSENGGEVSGDESEDEAGPNGDATEDIGEEYETETAADGDPGNLLDDPAEAAEDDSTHESDPPATPRPKWQYEFYPQSMVRDQGSITIAPNRTSALWQRGLRYCQMYNSSKEIFAAGNHYLFGNVHFDSLALDPGMLRSMQHVGGAMSHSPLALMRGYLHTKHRSHVALQACRERSYGTREEYRVTGAVLVAIDTILRDRGLADQAISLPADSSPVWIHPTALMVDWWRWNINKLCVGFEMTYSLQPRTFVHWEHTRVMMMFLKCLLHVYGGAGSHPRRSLGLWIDRQTKPPPEGSDVERIQEGMAMGDQLAQCGYAWLANKLDWSVMVFLPSCRDHMVFNTPSLQSTYHERYWKVKQTKGDFLLFHDVLQRLVGCRHHRRQSALLLRLLVDLCLRAFRQDVFRDLAGRTTNQPLQTDAMKSAIAGDVPLTIHGFQQVFQGGLFTDDVRFVQTAHAAVTHIDGLFVRLWGWDGDGDHGNFRRKHWEYKSYRVLFRQSFGMVAQVHGMQQAREWRQRLRETWIRTHWIIPYPSSNSFWYRGHQNKLQVWSSVHPTLMTFSQRPPQSTEMTITPDRVDYLPISGWRCAQPTSALAVELPPIPDDLDGYLATVSEDPSPRPPDHERSVPLPASGMLRSSISEFIREHTPEQRFLRSFKAEVGLEESQVHSDAKWQLLLEDHCRALIFNHQEEIKGRQQPKLGIDRLHRSPAVQSGLAQLNVTLADLEDGDSDSGNVRARCDAHSRRLGRMQQRLRYVEKRNRTIQEQNSILDRIYHRTEVNRRFNRDRIDWNIWMQGMGTIAQQARQIKQKCRRDLRQLSRESTQYWSCDI